MGRMKVIYDPGSDILYLIVKQGPIFDGKELDGDIRIEYDDRKYCWD
jgi:uncharacterized protein YuzE